MVPNAARKAGLKVARNWSSVSVRDGSKRRASKGTRVAVRADVDDRLADMSIPVYVYVEAARDNAEFDLLRFNDRLAAEFARLESQMRDEDLLDGIEELGAAETRVLARCFAHDLIDPDWDA